MARAITAGAIIRGFDGQVPKTMEEMLSIPGAARKTANVVLGTAYGIASPAWCSSSTPRAAATRAACRAALAGEMSGSSPEPEVVTASVRGGVLHLGDHPAAVGRLARTVRAGTRPVAFTGGQEERYESTSEALGLGRQVLETATLQAAADSTRAAPR